MVTLQAIAKILSARLLQPTSLLLDPKTRGLLTSEGMRMACERGWLVESDGMTYLTDRADAQVSIHQMAESPVPAPAKVTESLARSLILAHSQRPPEELQPIIETAAVSKVTIPKWEPFDLHARRIAEQEDHAIGDQVLVTDDGQVYAAVVKAKTADGYELSFPGDRKPKAMKPSYAKNEIGTPDKAKPGTSPAPAGAAKVSAARASVPHIYGVGSAPA